MLNSTLNEREDQYQTLNDFTKRVHREIIDITSNLDWTLESIETDDDKRLVCTYDSSHRIGKKILDQHLESCRWKKEGYNEFDIPLSEPSLPSSSPSCIKLDTSLQNSILQEAKKIGSTDEIGMDERLIPRTSDRIYADFTTDERKILYEYVVSNTVKTDIGYDITDNQKLKYQDEKEDKKLSFIELLVQERNLKRRRAKHRGVHTNKKSHTEILREVINQQMELYIDCITEMRAINRDTNTLDKNFDDTMQASSLSLSDTSLKNYNYFLEDSQDYRVNSKSRNKQKYEQSEIMYSLCSKDREKQEKCSQSAVTQKTTESWRILKSHKRRRSRSRDRDYKRSKYYPMRQHHKKNSIKSRETEKSFDNNCYSKYSSDRR